MSCVAPVRRIVNDKVGSGENVKGPTASTSMHEDQQANKEPPPPSLPPLPQILPASPSPVSPPSDQAFVQAAAIFQQLRLEKPATQQLLPYGKKTSSPWPHESGDRTTQRQAVQLAFNTLKYQDLLEDIITDSCFHTSQHISGDLLPLAMVMLFDFQERKFLLRKRSPKEGEELLQEVRDLESCLQRCKTKLAASLARCRVRLNLRSVSRFLSDAVRTKQHRAKQLPLYAWVNTLRHSVDDVCGALRAAGLSQGEDVSGLQGSTFCRDPLCPDTLVFPPPLHALLERGGLTAEHMLHTQDRSVCVAVTVLRPLLFEKGDVLVVGSFSAVTVAHVAVVAAERSGRVLVCGADHTPQQREEIQQLLGRMDVRNVRVLSEAFCGLDEWDAVVQRLKVIMVLPQCSCSGLNDPVPTIHGEHGDWDLLQDLSHGSVSQGKINTMANQQARLLAHALSFPKVQTVVYCTRSVYPEENEQLVKRVLEKAHTHSKLLPFRVNGPIFPNDSRPGDAEEKFFRLETSQVSNGCFIARLSRQADPTKVETVQDVLARAAAKGLLGGIIPEQSKPSKKGKGKKNHEASPGSKATSPSGQETLSGQDPSAPSEGEEKKGECTEEERAEDKVGKKKRVLKGNKRKVKRREKHGNKSAAVSKNLPKTHKKRAAKRKNSQSHHRRRLAKPRRIPRLTLTLMSSAKPSRHLSPITALAHRLSDSPAVKSLHAVPSSMSPAHPAPPAAPRQLQRQNPRQERAAQAAKPAAKPESRLKSREKVDGPKTAVEMQQTLKSADFILPPISLPPPSSVGSRSNSSVSQRPSRASTAQFAQISTSSSSVSLPGL